ncbi:SCP2 sterol-binding domain-containing protein [Microbulbifer thermotolerans]|nr:SCP2 sterol-binding domain-containing protein [Microbulbifer thermotolerans]WKT59240.1 SCP2 sterol-binding domain-containing protein [Microbulbifer thermotolerans]
MSPKSGDGGGKSHQVVSHFGHTQNPALTLEMAKGTLSAIWEGRLSARHAFLLGDIRYSGNRELAASLADLFPAEH